MKKIIAFAILFFISGCSHIPFIGDVPEVKNPTPIVEEVKNQIKDSSEAVEQKTKDQKKEADNIKSEADKIKNRSNGEFNTEIDSIDESAGVIKNKADEIDDIISELQASQLKLDQANNLISDMITNENILRDKVANSDKQIEELEKQVADKNEKLKSALYSRMIYLIMAAVVMIAVCVVQAFQGSAKAMWGAGGGIIVIVLALTISFYAEHLALVGIIGVIIVLAILGFLAYNRKIERVEKEKIKKVNTEVIHTVEAMKEKMNPNQKVKIFGTGATPGTAHQIQSKETMDIVNEIRAENKKHWRPLLDN